MPTLYSRFSGRSDEMRAKEKKGGKEDGEIFIWHSDAVSFRLIEQQNDVYSYAYETMVLSIRTLYIVQKKSKKNIEQKYKNIVQNSSWRATRHEEAHLSIIPNTVTWWYQKISDSWRVNLARSEIFN